METSSKPPVIFLMGPTASGKTELAMYLHERLPVEVISVDSAMVYRDMNIGTAKPTPEELSVVPHRLIDICDPSEAYSAGQFRRDALKEIEDVYNAGRIPLLAGGTFLYFRALEHGWADLPEADREVRKVIDTEAEQKGWAFMHEQLAQVDPEAAKRLHPNDAQRIQRALEVFRITGEPLSNWQRWSQQPCPFDVVKIAIQPISRDNLSDRIAARFDRMMEQGLLEEVEQLYNRGDLTVKLPSMRAVGYRQLWRHLDGKHDLQEAKSLAVIATRQLAKRQMTWLRSEKNLTWIQGDNDAARWRSMREVLGQLPGS